MSNTEDFKSQMQEGYKASGEMLILGGAMLNDDVVLADAPIQIPTKMLNRHGLIAGATGTGKTKTMQLIAETMSSTGIPCLLMDLKGDLSGLAVPGADSAGIQERHSKIGLPFSPEQFPVEILTLSEQKGVRLRATVSEFGPILFSKILELNDTQAGIISLVFKYSDDNGLLLLDLKDMKKVLQYITNEGKDAIQAEYGSISSASVGTIMRKIVELEQQGAEAFFGETSFDPEDLLRVEEGKGLISIIRLNDLQDRPKLFSTFMLSLLAEIYETFPEQGDADKPRLCIFIDEAHLIFNNASKALLDQIESIVKLIRSKGVGIYFVTQNPSDVPDAILGQLGLKVQHALRAFTAKDRKDIKLTAQNYPISDFYDTAEMLTGLGIGEAAITALDAKGRPTPLARTMLRAPRTRMGILSELELGGVLSMSKIAAKYNEEIDRESAYEMLTEKLAKEEEEQAPAPAAEQKKAAAAKPKSLEKEEGMLESFTNSSVARQMGRTAMREITRGLFGAITGRRPRSRSRRGWF